MDFTDGPFLNLGTLANLTE